MRKNLTTQMGHCCYQGGVSVRNVCHSRLHRGNGTRFPCGRSYAFTNATSNFNVQEVQTTSGPLGLGLSHPVEVPVSLPVLRAPHLASTPLRGGLGYGHLRDRDHCSCDVSLSQDGHAGCQWSSHKGVLIHQCHYSICRTNLAGLI